ncbi:MAG: LemA family protein [Isosphaeraceae bacterium]
MLMLGLGYRVVVLGLFVAGSYNALVALRNRFKNAFSQIDVQLKRRNDLIPNLVDETVKGYMSHEKGTLEAVIQARNAAVTAGKNAAANPGEPPPPWRASPPPKRPAQRLARPASALAEAYPDLKANQNMLALQEELTSTENKIAFSRQAYNDAVMHYNTSARRSPRIVVANFLNFTEAKSLSRSSRRRNASAEGLVLLSQPCRQTSNARMRRQTGRLPDPLRPVRRAGAGRLRRGHGPDPGRLAPPARTGGGPGVRPRPVRDRGDGRPGRHHGGKPFQDDRPPRGGRGHRAEPRRQADRPRHGPPRRAPAA